MLCCVSLLAGWAIAWVLPWGSGLLGCLRPVLCWRMRCIRALCKGGSSPVCAGACLWPVLRCLCLAAARLFVSRPWGCAGRDARLPCLLRGVCLLLSRISSCLRGCSCQAVDGYLLGPLRRLWRAALPSLDTSQPQHCRRGESGTMHIAGVR